MGQKRLSADDGRMKTQLNEHVSAKVEVTA